MKTAAGVLKQLSMFFIGVVAALFVALHLFRPHESPGSRAALALMLAVPPELAGIALYLRSQSDRARSIGLRRSKAEAAGVLAIVISLFFAEASYVSPQHIGDFLLFSWRAGTIVLLCVAGMISAGFGKGKVRTAALLAGLTTLGLWYVLAMAP